MKCCCHVSCRPKLTPQQKQNSCLHLRACVCVFVFVFVFVCVCVCVCVKS